MYKDLPVISFKNVFKSTFLKTGWCTFFSSTNTGFRAFFYYIRAPGISEVPADEH